MYHSPFIVIETFLPSRTLMISWVGFVIVFCPPTLQCLEHLLCAIGCCSVQRTYYLEKKMYVSVSAALSVCMMSVCVLPVIFVVLAVCCCADGQVRCCETGGAVRFDSIY